MKLYFVAAICRGTAVSLDLFVKASTPEQAIELWQRHYERHEDDALEDGEESELPEKVFEVPGNAFSMQVAGALEWHTMIPCVWERP